MKKKKEKCAQMFSSFFFQNLLIFFSLEIISYITLPVGKNLPNFTTYSLVQIWVHKVYVLISGKNPIIKVLYHSLNGRSGNFLSLACACWWWQQKASWPKFDYKVVSILTETFFLLVNTLVEFSLWKLF